MGSVVAAISVTTVSAATQPTADSNHNRSKNLIAQTKPIVPNPKITIDGITPTPGVEIATPTMPRAVAPSVGDISVSNIDAGIPQIKLDKELDRQLGSLKVQEQRLQQVTAEVNQVTGETQSLASVLFSQTLPLSAILQDLRENTPQGVQIASVIQGEAKATATPPATAPVVPKQGGLINKISTPPDPEAKLAAKAASPAVAVSSATAASDVPSTTLEIMGTAKSFAEVNNFVLALKRSVFFNPDDTHLLSSSSIESGALTRLDSIEENKEISAIDQKRLNDLKVLKLPKVIEYKIHISLKQISSADTIRNLFANDKKLDSFLQPQIAKNQELDTKLSETQRQIDQRKDNAKKIAVAEQNLARANAQKQVVLNLFANDKKLDTLLLDLSKLINIRQGELQRFVPDAPVAGNGSSGAAVVNDGSLGAALNNKLKRKGVSISLDGTFEQVQSILRTIERLDQLLIVKDFHADVDKTTQKIVMDDRGKIIPQPPATLKTTFKLQALIPLTAAEQAAATPPAPPAKK
jgi:Tfp pilus assembly protein PilN